MHSCIASSLKVRTKLSIRRSVAKLVNNNGYQQHGPVQHNGPQEIIDVVPFPPCRKEFQPEQQEKCVVKPDGNPATARSQGDRATISAVVSHGGSRLIF